MSLTYYKNSIIVTGVTDLLRVISLPRNTVKAPLYIHYSHSVTPVTGLCARARVGKNNLLQILLINKQNNNFLTCEECTRNTRNTRNNHCFYYIFNLIRRNNLGFTRNKLTFTRNIRLENIQG